MADTIKIPGELESVATGNKVVDIANVKDKTKGNKSQFQINAEHETALSNRYTKEETYNKEEVEQMVTPPNPDYKYYATYADMVAETSHPAGAIYRVSSYDGTQVDATSYAEYTWNGSEYKLLAVKSQVNEVFDISTYHATGGTLATYTNLAAALDSNNSGGVPQSLQKGGMSIKFVHTSDNKYAQYRLMKDTFSTTSSDWQGVDAEPIAGSKNMVTSGGVRKGLAELTKISLDDFYEGGYYRFSDGEFVSSSARRLTDFFEVSEGDVIFCKIARATEDEFSVVAFDNSKAIVTTSSVINAWNNGEGIEYTVPAGVKYLRFCEGGMTERYAEVILYNSVYRLRTDIEAEVTRAQAAESLLDGKIDTETGKIDSSKYLILPFDTDVQTTRLQIPSGKRKQGLMVGYSYDDIFIVEKYLKSSIIDVNWKSNANWERVVGKNYIDNLNFSLGVNETENLVTEWCLGELTSDGSFDNTASGGRASEFISVTPGETLYIIAKSASNAYPVIVCYDSNKANPTVVLPTSANYVYDGDYTIPSGCAYIRISRQIGFKYNYGVWRNVLAHEWKKMLSVNITNVPFIKEAALLYIKTNFNVTGFTIKSIVNNASAVTVNAIYNEETHPTSTWQASLSLSQSTVRKGFVELVRTWGPSEIKIGLWVFDAVNKSELNISVPVDNIIQDDINPVDTIWETNNKIGVIVSNEVPLNIRWKQGRLNMNGTTYTGWTNSSSYWNSGYIKLPAGDYKLIGKSYSPSDAPLIIKFNNDYTFNSVLIQGTTTVATYTLMLSEDTIVALNTQESTYTDMSLVRVNTGELDLCKNFSEVNNQLYYKNQPVGSETISTLVTDLPVSDGTGIEDGYAYIDSSTYVIKVKHS